MPLALPDGNKKAAEYFIDANTPLFIVRKLRNDNSVLGLSQENSVIDLLARFKEEMHSKPSSIYEEVNPYIYLVALFLRNDVAAINEAANVENTGGYKWIREILTYMQSSIIPDFTITIDVGQAMMANERPIFTQVSQ